MYQFILLCNIGCITNFDNTDHNNNQDDGAITLLDYAIMIFSIMSESNLFIFEKENEHDDNDNDKQE